MAYRHIPYPESGTKIRVENDRMLVPDNPILGYIEGDGIGPDITSASLRVWDAAVEKAYGERRRVHWAELYLGEKAAGLYAGDYFPEETLDAIRDLVVAVKGPLTTPVQLHRVDHLVDIHRRAKRRLYVKHQHGVGRSMVLGVV